MTSAAFETPQRRALSAPEHSAQLRKAVIASTIGTTIEWMISSSTARLPD